MGKQWGRQPENKSKTKQVRGGQTVNANKIS